VVEALAAAGGGDGRLLGVGGAALERSIEANRHVVGAPTLPAWQRYTGVVWDHLDPATLRGASRKQARRSVLVVSAIAGLSAFDDPLPDHRLKLSVRLDPLGKLSRWWRDRVTETLAETLAGRLVVDLLPQEHAAAWRPDTGTMDLRRVRFVGADGRAQGHAAKAAKGLLARALVETDDPDRVLATWSHDGLTLEVD
jgi:cytoplasmic iron level regulating protein YaaA (DUF328/UPF0246 family)